MSFSQIELLDHMGSDNQIANTARISMTDLNRWHMLPEGYTEEQRNKLIKYLAEHDHTSPFRHTAITVQCKVPIFLARQLGKHQVGMSWNEESRRYRDHDVTCWSPEEWRMRPDGSIKQGSGSGFFTEEETAIITDVYMNATGVAMGAYADLLERGVAPEQARAVLPQAMFVEFIWTGSLTSFAHVYNLRIDKHAQKEAQDFAEDLDKIIRPLFPVSWGTLTGS